MKTCDLLIIGPHPDDAEIGAGGIMAGHTAAGLRVAVLDLTWGEMGSNGTPALRRQESAAAARLLGLEMRLNAGLPDGSLDPRDPDQVAAVVTAIRWLRPATVLGPYGEDRHPDHGEAARLVHRAVFTAGLTRYHGAASLTVVHTAEAAAAAAGDVVPDAGDEAVLNPPVDTGEGEDRPGGGEPAPWRPGRVGAYFINGWTTPSLLVDISPWREAKRRALAAHRSQFGGRVPTPVSSSRYLAGIEDRDRFFGSLMGVEAAEGLVLNQPPLVRLLTNLPTGGTGRNGDTAHQSEGVAEAGEAGRG